MASYRFKVAKAPVADIGLGRIRIHYTQRDGARRFTIFRITLGQKSFLANVLGHEDAKDKVMLDIDQRIDLNVDVDHTVDLTLTRAGFWERVRWYLTVPDPAIHMPARLAAWSVALGVSGLALGVISLAC